MYSISGATFQQEFGLFKRAFLSSNFWVYTEEKIEESGMEPSSSPRANSLQPGVLNEDLELGIF